MFARHLLGSASRLGLLAALGLSLLVLDACRSGTDEGAVAPARVAAVSPPSARSPEVPALDQAPKPFAPARPGCEVVAVYTAGVPNGSLCVDDVAANGLTVLDLSDDWTPRVLAVDPETGSASPYRARYLELAREPGADLGLHGIAPTLAVVAARLSDEERRTCDAAVDLAPLEALRAELRATPDARAAARVVRARGARPAVAAAQAELVCARLLRKSTASGVLNGSTEVALEAFRRRHMIVGASLDDETLAALALGGDDLAFRGVLRVLRERVAEAGGLLEDGSAAGTHALVVDRALDLSPFAPPAEQALPGGVGDFVGVATDRAARELGWTSPDAARTFFAAHGEKLHTLRAAVALPPPPAYYASAMELRVEIDRGDVFYETPGAAAVARRELTDVRRPSFVLYARDGERERPLVRWSTTIGGWKKERTEEGEVVLKYKESDVGERVWRQIVAAPAWLPPDSTPEGDLVSERQDGSVALKRALVEPGYRNAYGLVMLVHEEVTGQGDETRFVDHGIRTHGSVDYRSIRRGESHGCHRLYNQLALRLSGFVLEHRRYVRRGKMSSGYHRDLEWNGETLSLDIPTRGYLYELDPPVPVRVLRGHVLGERQKAMSSVIRLASEGEKES